MIKNIIPFIIISDGTKRPIYRPTLRARNTHTNIIQVIAPFDFNTNIGITYSLKNSSADTHTEYAVLTDFKGSDVLSPDRPDYQELADFNVWELTVSHVPLNGIVLNRSYSVDLTFNIFDTVSEQLDHSVYFGLNGDLPEELEPDTLYINDRINFYSERIGRRLYLNESFKLNEEELIVRAHTSTILTNTTKETVTVESSLLRELPESVPPVGVDFNALAYKMYEINTLLNNHTGNKLNPHGVTAEQVDTYVKSVIDNKDTNVLQEAKDYTYSQSEIDNKDTNVLQEAKDYTYSQSEIDNKDTAVLTEAKGYTDGKISVITDLIKIDDTTITRNNNDELEVSTVVLDDIESRVPKNEFETFKTANTNKINAVENGLQIQIDEMEFVVDITLAGNDIKIEHRDGDITYIPINESVESGYYDTNTGELVLGLANGNEVRIPAGDIVAGLSSTDYVDTGLELKENKSNKITELVGVPNNTQYMSAKLTNDLIVAVRTEINSILDNKVDKVSGKGLSTNDFTNNDKNKLDGIESGAEVNPYSKTQLDNMFDDKVDKVSGMGLSKNDFTNNDKNKLDGIESGAEVNPYSKTQLDNMFDDKVDKVSGMGLSKNDFTDEYKNKVDDTIDDVSQLQTGKQDKLTAGTNITIGENNVISASGGMATVTWQDVENKPELYNKSEIDLMLGDIESALDAILGV